MKMKMNDDGLLYKIILPDLLNNIVDQLNKNDNIRPITTVPTVSNIAIP